MTVTQLLKQVKALPAEQRDQLIRELLALEDASQPRPARGCREGAVTWPDIEARAKQIVGDRILPNLVLLERGDPKTLSYDTPCPAPEVLHEQ